AGEPRHENRRRRRRPTGRSGVEGREVAACGRDRPGGHAVWQEQGDRRTHRGRIGAVVAILAVANQKGGVAKTTTVASVGAALAEQGQRVLLVDLDPQACLTFSLGLDPEELDISVHDVMLGRVTAATAVRKTDDGVDLLPATIELSGSEALLM